MNWKLVVGVGGTALMLLSVALMAYRMGTRAEREDWMARELAGKDAIIKGQQAALETLSRLERQTSLLEQKFDGLARQRNARVNSEGRQREAVQSDEACRAFLDGRFPVSCGVRWQAGQGGGDREGGSEGAAGEVP